MDGGSVWSQSRPHNLTTGDDMRSSDEIAREKNEEKLEKFQADKLARFERGLEALSSFDLDKTDKDVSQEKYLNDSHDDLRKIMRKGNVVTKWGESGKDEDAE
jgi:hypothetical protein